MIGSEGGRVNEERVGREVEVERERWRDYYWQEK